MQSDAAMQSRRLTRREWNGRASEFRVYFGETLTSPTEREARPTRRGTETPIAPHRLKTTCCCRRRSRRSYRGSRSGGGDSVITGPAADGGSGGSDVTGRQRERRARAVRESRTKVDSFIVGRAIDRHRRRQSGRKRNTLQEQNRSDGRG